ncbi:MAG: nucleoside triphosphate pyrophosphohydrolase [Butyricicoccus sp.]|nr:nucleoside triphosphate pyrophosphohydrolase [Butyricicoccus sp.]
MVDFEMKDKYNVNDLVRIMEILRAPDGCMWDQAQDHHSIRQNFIEETYEACEAIDDNDTDHLKEELGDVLLQVVFHTQMEKEKGVFDLNDVADGVCKKLIFRHPHIFGDVKVGSTDEILSNWDDLKRKEKKQETDTSTLESVSKSLPSLIRAQKLQKKAAKVGFDWPDVSGALDKVEEELAEVRAAIGGNGDIEEEIGDLIFAVTNVSRFVKVDSERAAEKTCNKFVRRFADMEKQAAAEGKDLSDLTLSELDALWDKAKEHEHQA